MSQVTEYSFGYDPILVRKYVDAVKGGKLLDLTGFTDDTIKAGHVIIRDTATQSVYKPMPVSTGAYAALPDGYEYVGINIATVLATEPLVSILTIGEVNENVMPYPITSIKSALKAAVPTIVFAHD